MAEDKRISELLASIGTAAFLAGSTVVGLASGTAPYANELWTGEQIRAYCSPSFVSPRDYGLFADGGLHPLSDLYFTLGAAQADYYFATALTQQIDYCACKKSSNVSFGGDLEIQTAYTVVSQASDDTHIYDSTQNWTVNEHANKTAFRKFESNGFVTSVTILSNTATILTLASPMPFGEITSLNEYAIGYGEHGSNAKLNKKLILPGGRYNFGTDTWTIRNLVGGIIEGAGTEATVLISNNCVIRFDGVWRSAFSNFSVLALTDDAVVAFDFDGNVPGHPYATRGLQGSTFTGLLIDGATSTYAFAMNRLGGDGGQGDHHVFINCDFASASFACYYQLGYNSLCNTLLGGDMQNYTRNGIYVNGGTVTVINTSFESISGYHQIENDGWDINVGDGGSFEGCEIRGCRTESLRFLRNGGAVTTAVSGVGGQPALVSWFASLQYGPTAALYKAINDGFGRLWVTSADGVTGATKPDFQSIADGGTIADNTIVWTNILFNFIDLPNGTGVPDLSTITYGLGRISAPSVPFIRSVITSDTTLYAKERSVMVDATAGAVTISILAVTSVDRGKRYTVKKVDTSANAVMITAQQPVEGGGFTLTIPGGTRGSLTIEYQDGEGGSPAWWIV